MSIQKLSHLVTIAPCVLVLLLNVIAGNAFAADGDFNTLSLRDGGNGVSNNTNNTVNIGPKKLGIAWTDGNDPALKNFAYAATYLHTWQSVAPDNRQGLQFAPMLFSNDPGKISSFVDHVKSGYAKYVIGPNEFNNKNSATYLSPSDLAALWLKYIQPLKNQGYKLVCPSTINGPDSFDAMGNFFAACKSKSSSGCTCDYIALNYYDVTGSGFIGWLKQWHNAFGIPLWVTEYACQNFNTGAQCNLDQVWSFHKQASEFMESTDWIAAYFPFGFLRNMQNVNPLNQLMGGDGQPTQLGSTYINHSF